MVAYVYRGGNDRSPSCGMFGPRDWPDSPHPSTVPEASLPARRLVVVFLRVNLRFGFMCARSADLHCWCVRIVSNARDIVICCQNRQEGEMLAVPIIFI